MLVERDFCTSFQVLTARWHNGAPRPPGELADSLRCGHAATARSSAPTDLRGDERPRSRQSRIRPLDRRASLELPSRVTIAALCGGRAAILHGAGTALPNL